MACVHRERRVEPRPLSDCCSCWRLKCQGRFDSAPCRPGVFLCLSVPVDNEAMWRFLRYITNNEVVSRHEEGFDRIFWIVETLA